MRSLVLFSNDLRLNDNDAINNSIKNHKSTAFVFIFDKNLYKKSHGSANLWWLEESLSQLRKRLLSKKIHLNILMGEYVPVALKIIKNNNVKSVFMNQNKHPEFIKKENNLSEELYKININLYSFNKTTLEDPKTIMNKSGEPYKVYTPFYKHCKSIYSQKKVLKFPYFCILIFFYNL